MQMDDQQETFTNVYIKNLPEDMDDDKLAELGSRYGVVLSAKVMTNDDKKSKGFGFINFENHECAQEFIVAVSGTDLNGKTLFANRAQKKAERAAQLKAEYEALKQERSTQYQAVNLYVKNLADAIDDERLREEFSRYGTITSAKVITNDKAKSKGFGFVCFSSPEEAAKALSDMNGRIILAKPLYVARAQRKEERRAKLACQRFERAAPEFWDEVQLLQLKTESNLESRALNELSAPPEILARGPEAIRAYTSALKDGKKKVFRTRLMLVGQEGVGKTSLKKSLTGQRFDPEEAITDGVETEDICEITIEHIELHKDDKVSWSVKQNGSPEDFVGEFKQVLVEHIVSSLRENTSQEQASSEASLEPDSNESDDSQGEAGAHGEKIPDVTEDKATTSLYDSEETSGIRLYGDETGAESSAVPLIKDERSKMEATGAPEAPKDTREDEGLPDGIAELLEERLKVEGVESGNDEGKDKASLNIWDFAGHDVYYTTHQVFLTWRAIYVVVFDLSRDLDSVVPPECRNRCYQRAKQGTKSELTCLEFIEFWLYSIYAHAVRPSPKYSDSTKKTAQRSPPIFIVGTHRDEVGKESEGDKEEKRKEKITAAFDRIRTIIKGKPFECHVIPRYYQIENSLEGDKELSDLRKHIEQVAKDEPYMGEEIPLKWLKFEEFHATNTKNDMTLNQIKEQTQQIGIESEKELLTMLNFYHDLGLIIYYGDVKETESLLRDMVILNPQWLIDVFKQVITILEPAKRDGIVSDAWTNLEDHGILEDRLIQHMWQGFQEQKHALVELMMMFYLICKVPAKWCQQEEADCEVSEKTAESPKNSYYVPSRLPPQCQQKDTSQVNKKSSVEFYIDFRGFLPEGLFHRLMARVVEQMMDRGEQVCLFYRQISMTIGDEHEALMTMLPPSKAAVQVNVFRAKIIPLEAKSVLHTPDPQIPDPNAVKEVRDIATKTLDSLIQQLAKNLRYDIGFTCPNSECCTLNLFKDCFGNEVLTCAGRRNAIKRCFARIPSREVLLKFGYLQELKALEEKCGPKSPGNHTSSIPEHAVDRYRTEMIVTEVQLLAVSKNCPHQKFIELSRELGTAYNPAQAILEKHKWDYHKALMEILMDWKNKTGGPYSVLAAALRGSGVGDLVAHIEPGTSPSTSNSEEGHAVDIRERSDERKTGAVRKRTRAQVHSSTELQPANIPVMQQPEPEVAVPSRLKDERERSDERKTGAVRKRTGAHVHSSTELQPANIPIMQQPEPQVEIPPRLRDERQEKEYSIIFIITVICLVLFIFLFWGYTGFTFM